MSIFKHQVIPFISQCGPKGNTAKQVWKCLSSRHDHTECCRNQVLFEWFLLSSVHHTFIEKKIINFYAFELNFRVFVRFVFHFARLTPLCPPIFPNIVFVFKNLKNIENAFVHTFNIMEPIMRIILNKYLVNSPIKKAKNSSSGNWNDLFVLPLNHTDILLNKNRMSNCYELNDLVDDRNHSIQFSQGSFSLKEYLGIEKLGSRFSRHSFFCHSYV